MLSVMPRQTAAVDPQRLAELGKLVRNAREGLRLSVDTAADRSEMSPVTWGRVEKGLTVRTLTYAGIEPIFGWERGSIAGFLAGGPSPVVEDEGQASLVDEGVENIKALGLPPLYERRAISRYQRRMAEYHKQILAEIGEDMRQAAEEHRDVI
jgi:transcriptional regulator with XRE-family HTH domain